MTLWNRYGILNVYCGLSNYDPYLYQVFNIFYAALPIIIYAVFDEEMNHRDLENNPAAYQQGKNRTVPTPLLQVITPFS